MSNFKSKFSNKKSSEPTITTINKIQEHPDYIGLAMTPEPSSPPSGPPKQAEPSQSPQPTQTVPPTYVTYKNSDLYPEVLFHNIPSTDQYQTIQRQPKHFNPFIHPHE